MTLHFFQIRPRRAISCRVLVYLGSASSTTFACSRATSHSEFSRTPSPTTPLSHTPCHTWRNFLISPYKHGKRMFGTNRVEDLIVVDSYLLVWLDYKLLVNICGASRCGILASVQPVAIDYCSCARPINKLWEAKNRLLDEMWRVVASTQHASRMQWMNKCYEGPKLNEPTTLLHNFVQRTTHFDILRSQVTWKVKSLYEPYCIVFSLVGLVILINNNFLDDCAGLVPQSQAFLPTYTVNFKAL